MDRLSREAERRNQRGELHRPDVTATGVRLTPDELTIARLTQERDEALKKFHDLRMLARSYDDCRCGGWTKAVAVLEKNEALAAARQEIARLKELAPLVATIFDFGPDELKSINESADDEVCDFLLAGKAEDVRKILALIGK